MDLEQIKRSHASAQPKPSNPAWVNTHRDLTFALSELDRLRAVNEALTRALSDLFAQPSGNPAADRIEHAKAWQRAREALALAKEGK